MISLAASFIVTREFRDDPSRDPRDVGLEADRRARLLFSFDGDVDMLVDLVGDKVECSGVGLDDGELVSIFDNGAEDVVFACLTVD